MWTTQRFQNGPATGSAKRVPRTHRGGSDGRPPRATLARSRSPTARAKPKPTRRVTTAIAAITPSRMPALADTAVAAPDSAAPHATAKTRTIMPVNVQRMLILGCADIVLFLHHADLGQNR